MNKDFNNKESLQNGVYVFIDASNLWQAQKVKNRLFDYKKLKAFLEDRFKSTDMQIFYYTAYPANGTRDYSLDSRHKFYTFLKKGLGFIVRKKELKRIIIHCNTGDLVQEKGNMDVEMTIDVLHFKDSYEVGIFFTGDSDFLPLIIYLKNINKKVYIFSSKNNISTELRVGSDGYIDILELEEDIWGRNLENKDKNI